MIQIGYNKFATKEIVDKFQIPEWDFTRGMYYVEIQEDSFIIKGV